MTEQINVTEGETINTKDLQIFSMMQAFGAGGYQLMRTNHGGLVFFNERVKGANLLSMEYAIRIYNNEDMSKTFFDAYALAQFNAAKVVQTLKMQYSKRTKSMLVQNNMVRFVKPEYEHMFLYQCGVSE